MTDIFELLPDKDLLDKGATSSSFNKNKPSK